MMEISGDDRDEIMKYIGAGNGETDIAIVHLRERAQRKVDGPHPFHPEKA